jgi:histone deacetylase 11
MSETHPHPKIVYSPHYDIRFLGLEKLHPFDSCKYSRTWKALTYRFGDRLQSLHLSPTHPIALETLSAVHTDQYLTQLKQPKYVAKALELPPLRFLPLCVLEQQVLKPMQLATLGTVMAAEAALEHGMAINLSGGYHHASGDCGEGFCIYADIAVAIAALRRSQKLRPSDPVAIVDLDAHQGNGLGRIFYDDPAVHILDMYNADIYPKDYWARAQINCNIPLAAGTRDEQYLGELKDRLPSFLQNIRPKIAFYNAGTDIYERDPLGGLRVSRQGVLDRDRFVFDTFAAAGIPWAMVLSGGYTRESHRLVAESVSYVVQTWL